MCKYSLLDLDLSFPVDGQVEMKADVEGEDSLFPGPYFEKNAQLFMQNSCLFDKIKEIENQVDKMHVHWRKLRSIESLKKKQR